MNAIAVASLALGVWLWLLLPHRAIGASFLLLELVTATQIAARLWMKAASAGWVALHADANDRATSPGVALSALAAEPGAEPR